jgi:hypothetical protein
MARNSVFDEFRDKRLADIQFETLKKTDRSWSAEALNCGGEIEMKKTECHQH